jgi:thiamine-phosphate pyrophosphorylase
MSAQDLGSDRRARLGAARLYLVCDSSPGGRDLAEVLSGAIAGGVQVVQLREKRLGEEELATVASTARAVCERLGALLIVNDLPSLALRCGADGVHVGQEDMPVEEVRALVGPEMLIGLSTHASAEIDALAADAPGADGEPASARPDREPASAGPDYIGVGPVRETPTKPGRPAVGLELVRYAAAHASLPFFAIGGIDAGNVGETMAAGARRVCVLRAIAAAEHPERAARELREQLDAHPLES